MQNNDNLNDILGLLAMTIFADTKILSMEIKAFVRAVGYLQSEQVITPELSEADIITWYEHHKDDLKAKVTGKGFEIWLEKILKNLTPVENKSALLIAMNDIANSDEEVHVSEMALVTLVARHWSLAA